MSLGGCDLLVEGVGVGLVVLDPVEVLAVDVGEGGAVAGVAEEQVGYRPDEPARQSRPAIDPHGSVAAG